MWRWGRSRKQPDDIPPALIAACERNEFVWHRENPDCVDAAFDELALKKQGQLYRFARRYCLQFASDTLPFQLADFVEDDGISDNVFYAREELGIDPRLVPVSLYEAASLYAVSVEDDRVLLLTPAASGDDWSSEVVIGSFYDFMQVHLA